MLLVSKLVLYRPLDAQAQSDETPVHPVAKMMHDPQSRPILAQYIRETYRVSPAVASRVVEAAFVAGEENGIDPVLALAIAAKESSMQPKAVSTAGAKGLMQVNEAYEKERMKKHGVHDLSDIEGNIRIGTEILSDYLVMAEDNLSRALQFYHAGPYAKRFFDYYLVAVKRLYREFIGAHHVRRYGSSMDIDVAPLSFR